RSRRATKWPRGCAATCAAAPGTRTSSTPSRWRRAKDARGRWPVADATNTPYVGRALKRIEDPRLITGAGTYVDDIRLPGMLHAAILRSPHAHAKILRIDTAAAKAIPGVVGVFTGADVNEACGVVPCGAAMPDLKAPAHTALAGDRVYFVGHAVAVVVATDPYVARDAIDAIDVDYDALPAVVDPEAAVKEGTPLTHPDLGTNIAYTHTLAGGD